MSSEQRPEAETIETEIVVVGGGGTGFAAAVAAAEQGAKVILLEKHSAAGGNTAMARGILAADSEVQKRMSIAASQDDVFKTGMEYSHWKINPRIWRTIVNKSANTIQWLENKGIKFNEIPSQYPGQLLRTWHCVDSSGSTGPSIIKVLRKNLEELGQTLITNCRVKRILTSPKGVVSGVLAESGGRELNVKAESVIIATGGYGGNKELLKKYISSYSDNTIYVGFPHNTGDGLKMAIEVGAGTDGLGTLMLHPPRYLKSIHVNAVAHEPFLIWINKNGERFTDETTTFHHIESGNAIDRQPDKLTYAVFDEKIKNRIIEEGIRVVGLPDTGIWAGGKLTNLNRELQAEVEKGDVQISQSWDGIAKWIGVPVKTLTTTINEYNRYCDQGYDEVFAKERRYLQELRTPPYYAIRCYLAFLTTVGGIKINQSMEVLGKQDKPIAGLYAGGDTTGGWEGDTYCMFLAGSALGFAINSGRIAGENASRYVSRKTK
jgi:fumarate reductase flavoprotein subunit